MAQPRPELRICARLYCRAQDTFVNFEVTSRSVKVLRGAPEKFKMIVSTHQVKIVKII